MYSVLFGSGSPSTTEKLDLVRECYDAIEQWKHDSPPGALTSRLVSKEAQQLQVMLTRNSGPTDLLLNAFPRLAGSDDFDVRRPAELVDHVQPDDFESGPDKRRGILREADGVA